MANLKDFLLPDLGEGLTEGEIVSWLVAVGDAVEVDQPVAEVETAKAVVEVPSPFAGTVARLHGEVGQEVEVGQPLVTVDLDGSAVAEEPGGEPGATAKDAAAGEMVPEPTDRAEPAGDDGDGDSGSVLVGYGTAGGARARRRRSGGPVPGAPTAAHPGNGRPLAKPPVRKLAKDLGVDLGEVRGSGPGGIVTRDDVHAAAAGDGDRVPEEAQEAGDRPGVAEPAEATDARMAAAEADLVERIPVRGVRKAVAQKMTASRREIPDATTWVDCDATRLWKLRQRLNASQSRVKVSPLAIILRACVAGLREFPELNARLDVEANEIVLQRFVNLGFAAQTATGLLVPNIKRADRRSLLGIAEELNRLAQAARERTVSPEDLAGGTFTVSNYGSFGVDGGSAVINHPEAAILGVGRISERPWVRKGKVEVRRVLQLSLAFDHRICDGGEAAGFLRFVADCVEDPATLVANL